MYTVIVTILLDDGTKIESEFEYWCEAAEWVVRQSEEVSVSDDKVQIKQVKMIRIDW